MFLPILLIQGEVAVSNLEDVWRLRELTHEGYFPTGYDKKAADHVAAYVTRIVVLRKSFRRHWWQFWRLPYPGPTVTEL